MSSRTGRASRSAKKGTGGDTAQRRTAYDYLRDGRYRADEDGRVNGKSDPTARDFTQGARDMVRDAGDAVGDLGRSIGGAVGGLGGSARNSTGK